MDDGKRTVLSTREWIKGGQKRREERMKEGRKEGRDERERGSHWDGSRMTMKTK